MPETDYITEGLYGPTPAQTHRPSVLAPFLEPFAWKTSHEAGCYAYQINSITKQRRAVPLFNGHSPINYRWLNDTA